MTTSELEVFIDVSPNRRNLLMSHFFNGRAVSVPIVMDVFLFATSNMFAQENDPVAVYAVTNAAQRKSGLSFCFVRGICG